MSNGTRRRDDGFTLIELLVVCVLLGVLAAIAVPSFLGTRTKGYRAQMAADLHAVLVAQEGYATGAGSYTTDLADLEAEGYRPTPRVTAQIVLDGGSYRACTSHPAVSGWLVHDAATGVTAMAEECA